MLKDLADQTIQPQNVNPDDVPEIRLSKDLRIRLTDMFKEEEKGYVKVSEQTSTVQTADNYVYFSNQWFYLAVICKDYAEALYPYCVFFNESIRDNNTILNAIKNDGSEDALNSVIDDEEDRLKMLKFIKGGDKVFRPGKNLINGDTVRSCKDIFGSAVLGKLAVPNSSAGYLGYIIYYLAKRHTLFESVKSEINGQLSINNNIYALPKTARLAAQKIIDTIYNVDKFERINDLFCKGNINVRIDTSKIQGSKSNGTLLNGVFVTKDSNVYYPKDDAPSNTIRVFTDKEYNVKLDGNVIKCRLTTQWSDDTFDEKTSGNYLRPLITVVNDRYNGLVKINRNDETKEGFMCIFNAFKFDALPTVFAESLFSRRFITSLLAKPFVILTGNSGTGKTRIAKQFATYLQEDSGDGEPNWVLVPVGADWTDNTKMLGFYNPLADGGKGRYEKTEILKLIERADMPENSNKPFFIILDEMNLSHVERYFADFLSHMETQDLPFVMDNYPDTLKYPTNLFVIGTVNIDETTYMFSPKVLDRANVIEFNPEEDSVMNLFTEPVSSQDVEPADDGTAESFMSLAVQIRNGECKVSDTELDKTRNHFDEVYKTLRRYGFEFAYRTVKEIRQYISATYELSTSSDFNLENAEDEQLLQKVLPKIHGNKKEIGTLLDDLDEICENNDWKLSKEKIEQMKGKLDQVQYASFI